MRSPPLGPSEEAYAPLERELICLMYAFRRAGTAGIKTPIGDRNLRGTGITAYLVNAARSTRLSTAVHSHCLNSRVVHRTMPIIYGSH